MIISRLHVASWILGLTFFIGLTNSTQGQDTLYYQGFQTADLADFITFDIDELELSDDFLGFPGGFSVVPLQGPTDYRAIAVADFKQGGAADNWLVSPLIDLGENSTVLSWSAFSLGGIDSKTDSYTVRISNGGSDIDDFNNIILNVNSESLIEGLRSIDLSTYSGSIRIAFHHNSTAGYALVIDDFLISRKNDSASLNVLSLSAPRYQNDFDSELFVELNNNGAETITDIVFNIDINGVVKEVSQSDIDLVPGSTTTMDIGKELNLLSSQRNDIELFVREINSAVLNQAEKFTVTTYTVLNSPKRNIVVEDITSTSCGLCPETRVNIEILQANFKSDLIAIAVHADDPMENVPYRLGTENSNLFTGFPTATYDRKAAPIGLDEAESYYFSNVNGVTPLSLSLSQEYEPTTRTIAVIASTEAFTTLDSEEHRLALVIKEDNVSGTDDGFAQSNGFSDRTFAIDLIDNEGVNWKDLSDPILPSEIVYNDVAREVIGGYDGLSASIGNLTFGESSSFEFKYTIPSAYNADNISMVLIAIDNTTGEILNAIEVELETEPNAIEEQNLLGIKIFPNPTYNEINITSDLSLDGNASVSIYNVYGQQVVNQQLKHIKKGLPVKLSIKDLIPGSYFLKIEVNAIVVTRRIIVL